MRKWNKMVWDVIQLLQRLQTVPSPSLMEVLQKASHPLHKSSLCKLMTVSKWQICQTPNNGLEWHKAYASFCVKNIFAVVHLYMSHQSAKIGFPVQTGLGVWLGFRTYYFSNLMRIWLLLNLCYVLRFLKCI